MPKAPSPPPPMDVSKVTEQSQEAKLLAGQQSQSLNTIGTEGPLGSLTYTTTIDPITGLPKYVANSKYSTEQQALLDQLQQNQQGIGGTAGSAIGNTFGQYEGDPNLVGQAGSLTNQALDAQLPAWERFDAPARDQLRTQLLNQGLTEGTPAYQQQMDKLTTQQDLNRGQWLSDFSPKAFDMAKQQYQTPLDNVMKMLGVSGPANLKDSFINGPQTNVGAADVEGLSKASQEQAFKNYQQKVAQQNAQMGMITGGITGIMGLPVMNPMGGGAGSLGGNMINKMMS